MAPLDQIHINGIRAYGYIGALPEEQVLGQWFEVDITLWLDLSQAGNSDRLDDTLNYCTIIEPVTHLINTAKYALLERLATEIAQSILHPSIPHSIPVHQVRVRLTKLHAPIPHFQGQIVIELTRSLTSGLPSSHP